MRYTYTQDGKLAKMAAVEQSNTSSSTYGPEKYVVEYKYDDVGRVVRKTVKDNPVQDSTTRYESDYTFDGMGRLVRERIWRYDSTADMMKVTQDTITMYDLGGNPTEIKFYDSVGWAYTETRTYVKGYQITNATVSSAGRITTITGGSFTYDSNGNMLTTKGVDIRYSTGAIQLAYRAQWTFEFDELNRLKNFTNTGTDNKRYLWYDARGRVWQRWNYDTNLSQWDATLNRYVYDGGALAQEHSVAASEVESAWDYTYLDLSFDYLHKPGGTRQISRSGGTDTYNFLLNDDSATPTARIERSTSSTVERMELKASGERQATGSTQDTHISNIGPSGGYIEDFSSKSGQTEWFDPLVEMGGRHALNSISQQVNSVMGVSVNAMPDGAEVMPSEKPDIIGLIDTDDYCKVLQCWVNRDHPCYKVEGIWSGQPRCWRTMPEIGPVWQRCHVVSNLSDCDCPNGVYCPGDFIGEEDCFEHETGFGDNFPGSNCTGSIHCSETLMQSNFNGAWSKVQKKIKDAVTKGCIQDKALARCIYRNFLQNRIFCNCNVGCDEQAVGLVKGITNCNQKSICIWPNNIITFARRFPIDPTKAPTEDEIANLFAVVIFHELVHLCLLCHMKRFDFHAIAAMACQRSCFGETNAESPPGEYGGHGYEFQWVAENCTICPSLSFDKAFKDLFTQIPSTRG